MSRYAEKTTVPVERSRNEIEQTLRRYGADQFAYGWDQQEGREYAMIGFQMHSRKIRFRLPLPSRDDPIITMTPTRIRRSQSAADRAYAQAVRQRWRALLLVIKAKLEAVEAGIVTFEDEFLAHTLLPDGRTVGESVHPVIEHAYQTGQVPALLPGVRQLGSGEQS